MKTLASAVAMALQGSLSASLYNNLQSGFDPKSFLQMQMDQANSTVRIPVPAGEHLAVISAVDCSKWTSKDGSKSGLRLDLKFSIDDANVKALLGRDKVELQQGVMLDLTEAGSLDFSKGRNVQLGRLRDAAGLNEAGKPFSFPMLDGKVVKIVVGHTPSDRPGAQPGDVFENVNAYVKA